MILKDIESLSDAEKLALVKTVQESVAANKAKQTTQEVGQYAKLVVDAIKKIKTDLEERYAAISADITVKAAAIKDGKDGQQGPKGEKGDRGFDGVNGKDGKNGRDGKDGQDGTNGTGVQDAYIDFDGSLVIALTDGREINAGEVVPLDVAEKIKVIGNGGGTSQYVLDAIAALQAEIDSISPTLVITDTFVVGSEAEMLALSSAEQGDVAVRTDLNKTFILKQSPYSTLANWQELLTPTNAVTSVAGRTGAVTLSNSDVSGSAASGANSDITSMSGITGAVGTVDYIGFDTSYSTTLAAGSLGWDGNNSLGLGMAGGNVIQHIGEDSFFYVKASSAITKGQVCMFTGAVGASGVVTAAPATGVTSGQYIMGIAAEDMAHNGFGLVQCFGTLKNINTTGFTDGDIVYYDSAVTGGFTKTFPTSGPIVTVAAVVNGGSSGSGIVQIRVTVTQRVSASTGISVSQSATGTTVTNSAPDQTVSLTGSGTTTVTGTYPNFTVSSSDAYTGTVTSVTGAAPVVSSGGTTPAISLAASYGDTQNPYASKTANYVLASPNGASGVPTFRAMVAADVPTLNQNTTGSAGSLVTTNFSIVESGGKLLIKYGATTVASISSTGVITSATNIVSNGTP